MDRQRDTQKERQIDGWVDRKIDKWIDRQMGGQRGKQADRYRQIDR